MLVHHRLNLQQFVPGYFGRGGGEYALLKEIRGVCFVVPNGTIQPSGTGIATPLGWDATPSQVTPLAHFFYCQIVQTITSTHFS